jgi:hypothetical protein
MPNKRNDKRFTKTNVMDNTAAATENSGSHRRFVTSVGPYDVLLGRGAPMVNFAGNVRFRELVAARLEEYSRARRRQTKDTIAREIMALVEQRGGRFLRKVDAQEEIELGVQPNDGASAWVSVEEDVAIEKVKQALRNREQQLRAPSAPVQEGHHDPPTERQRDSRQTNRSDANISALHAPAAFASGETEHTNSTERAQSAAPPQAPPPLHPLALLWQQQQQWEDNILRRQSQQQQQAAELLELLQIQQGRHEQQRQLEAALLHSSHLAYATNLGLNLPSPSIQQLLALRAAAAAGMDATSALPTLASSSLLGHPPFLAHPPPPPQPAVTGRVPNLTIGQQLLALQNLNQQAAASPTATPLNLNLLGLGSMAMTNAPQPAATAAEPLRGSGALELSAAVDPLTAPTTTTTAHGGTASTENGALDSLVATSRSALGNDHPSSDSSSSSRSDSKGDNDDERQPRSTSIDNAAKLEDSSSSASTEPRVLPKRRRLEQK